MAILIIDPWIKKKVYSNEQWLSIYAFTFKESYFFDSVQ